MKRKPNTSSILIYQAPNGALELKGDFDTETIWANQTQVAEIFAIDRSVATKHINNILKDKEVDEKSNVQNMHIPNSDKPVKFYSLDVILAVGYRTNSSIAIKFRQWATQTLKKHITKGYTINKKLLQKNYTLFQNALSDVQKMSQNILSNDDILELVKAFSSTRFSLNAFDKETLQTKTYSQKTIKLEVKHLYQDIASFKKELISKAEATDLFAQEKETGSLEGIFGNIFQTAFGEDVYPNIESKASHLLYFIVKNHPFNDGNKRSAAFAFIWFLQKTKYTFRDKITPEALTAITLLIAASDPKDTQKMIDLVIMLLRGNEK